MLKINILMKQHKAVERVLDQRYKSQRAKNHLKWSAIYALLLAIIIYDMKRKCPQQIYTTFYWLECILGLYIALGVIYNIFKYMYYFITSNALHGTIEQKNLLSFSDDKSFIVKSVLTSPIKKVEPASKMIFISWHSSFSQSSGRKWYNWTLNRISPTRNIQYSPQNQQQKQSTNNISWHSSVGNNSSMNLSTVSSNSSFSSPYKRYTSEDIIDDDVALQEYLKDFNKRESSNSEVADINSALSMGSGNSFWNYCNSAANFFLKTSVYQLAPSTTPPTQSTQNNEDNSFQLMDANSDVIKGISSEKLSQYVANLRVWISTTILKRLVAEIKNVDEVFKSRGLFDMQIGTVGLERLRKTAEMPEIIELMPKLSVILPFLSLTNNQEYLVQRIKDLSNGACIADYRWNSGSSYNGVNWDEHLPTDAAILFHLFCIYLDCQLLPLPQGGGRPFSSRYVIMSEETRSPKEVIAAVNNKAQCAIYCINPMRPKFYFISEKQIHNCSYNRNNLFYVIIQFLIYMKAQQDCSLEGVNLGKTGMNIMCVIED